MNGDRVLHEHQEITMLQRMLYNGRVICACMKKDIKSALTERVFTIISVFLPLNFLILLSLFVVSGGLAPTAVVMQDTGPYAQQFYNAMAHAHSFALQRASASQAEQLITAGRIVAVVTIPPDFDTRIQSNQPVQVNVKINNLNTDFTNDIRRAVPLSITTFYAKAFPNVVSITTSEHDFYQKDTDYIPYLTVSILVIALVMSGLLQAGTASAREWENATMKELMLSPASRWAIVIGKMLGSFALTLIIFIAWGTLLGTLIKQRQAFVALAFGTALPLSFLSGAFGPISFNTQAIQVIAQIFPVYYAIVLQQHAFHNFTLNTYGLGTNILVLCAYALGLIILAAIVLRRSTVAN